VDDAWLETSLTPAAVRLAKDLHIASLLTVPLMVANRALGALTFGFSGGRRHGRRDLGLAQELAGRAALALENSRLYEQAQQAIRVREQILALVSHDLANPLTGILMGIGILRRHQKAAAAAVDGPGEVLNRIERSAQLMQRLIEDLLDFASIERGRFALERAPHEPATLLAETVASFEAQARQRGIALDVEPRPVLAAIWCDHDRVIQVLANLVANAVKITSPPGRVTLRVDRVEHEVIFAVSDTGPGIAPGDLPHLFERYWRSGERRYSGTGLGLSIAQGIIQAHGGRIWVESELGRGSTFFFSIPEAREEHRRIGDKHPSGGGAPEAPPP
jgi:signal transduction histidine kinase